MIRLVLAALALACLTLPASARPRHAVPAGPAISCNGQGCSDWTNLQGNLAGSKAAANHRAAGLGRQSRRESRRIARGERLVRAVGFGAPVSGKEITRKTNNRRHFRADSALEGITHRNTVGDGMLISSTSFEAAKISITRPVRYIAGRLVCAINVNAELARRGIRGTGSALAKSFLPWGRASGPVPGAVAIYDRRGGGHVAIVSRVVGGRVYVWNPSSRSGQWREVEYRRRAIAYRVAG
jgi:hypothetical protein